MNPPLDSLSMFEVYLASVFLIPASITQTTLHAKSSIFIHAADIIAKLIVSVLYREAR